MSEEYKKPLVTIELAEYNALQKYIEKLESNYYGDNPYKNALEDVIQFIFNGKLPSNFTETKGGIASIHQLLSNHRLYISPSPFNSELNISLNKK